MLRKGVMSPRLQIEAVGRVQTAPPSSLGALGPKGGKTNAHFSKGKWRHHHPASQRWCDNNDIQSPSPPGGEVPCPPLRLFLQSLRFLRDMKTCNSSYGTRNFLHVFHPTPTSPHHSERRKQRPERLTICPRWEHTTKWGAADRAGHSTGSDLRNSAQCSGYTAPLDLKGWTLEARDPG